MNDLKHDILIRGVKILNIVLITIPFALCWYLYYASRIVGPFYRRGNWLVIAIFVVVYFAFARIYDAFKVSLNRISEMIYSQMLAALISDGIMYLIIWLLMKYVPNVLPGIIAIGGQLILSIAWSWIVHVWYYKVFPPKKTAVIYDLRESLEYLIDDYDMDKKFDVVLSISAEECLKDLSALKDIEAVFLGGVHSTDRNVILKYCINKRIQVYVIPRVGDVIMSGAEKMHLFHLPMMRVERYKPVPEFLLMKRFIDIFISLVATVIMSPFMLITAIAIKVYDGGPVLYKQCRLTKDGKKFNVLKFRSMKVDAEKDGVARLSTGENDDRITPVGKVIRKIRFDELPQLFNILSGDMSIVGPRPERPEIAAEYEKHMPEFGLRLQAKAGLTGYAQVYGKYNTTPYDKLQMDLMYIANPSIAEDMKIMFATVKILFMPDSTEGIAEGTTNAMSISSAELASAIDENREFK